MITSDFHKLDPGRFEEACDVAHGAIAGWCLGKGENPPALTSVRKEAYLRAFEMVYNHGYQAALAAEEVHNQPTTHIDKSSASSPADTPTKGSTEGGEKNQDETGGPAGTHLKDLLTTLQKQWNIALEDISGADDSPAAKEIRTMRMVTICDRFSTIWFLMRLMKLDSIEAELATIELMDVLNDGGAIGEWAWDLLTQIGVDPKTLLAEGAPA